MIEVAIGQKQFLTGENTRRCITALRAKIKRNAQHGQKRKSRAEIAEDQTQRSRTCTARTNGPNISWKENGEAELEKLVQDAKESVLSRRGRNVKSRKMMIH